MASCDGEHAVTSYTMADAHFDSFSPLLLLLSTGYDGGDSKLKINTFSLISGKNFLRLFRRRTSAAALLITFATRDMIWH